VGSAFSLWRAVFLADKPIRPAPAIPDAIKFLDRVVSDNIIGYADEKTSRRWTAGFYVGNIQYRMFHLNKSYQDELQVDALKFFVEEWNPFVSPGLSNRKEFFEDAIDCLHKLTKRLHDLAGKARKK
jgi:hypothetical protein